MDNDKKLKLIKLSAEDFKTFKTQFETLSPTEKMEFKNYMSHRVFKLNDKTERLTTMGIISVLIVTIMGRCDVSNKENFQK